MEQALQRGLSMEQERKPRTSMILLLEHVHAMDELTDEEFGAFIRNYAQYVEIGLEPAYDNDRAMRMLWKVVKAFDDMNAQKRQDRIEKNRRSANKRWNDEKCKCIQTHTNDANAYAGMQNMQMDANDALSVSDSVSESDKKEKCEKKNTNEVKRFKAPTVEEAKSYFSEKGYGGLEAERFIDHFTANGWKVGKSSMKDWKAAARNWMRNVKDWNGGYQQTMAELPDEGDFLR
jgi:hypothetical protein